MFGRRRSIVETLEELREEALTAEAS